MKAIVCTKYGSPKVLQLMEVEKPTPKADEVLIKIHAASVNAGDWHLMRGKPYLVRLVYGFLKPKYQILGADLAGVVEAVGANVTEFQVGDAVFSNTGQAGFGAFAEYVCVSENLAAHKPAIVSFEEVAAMPQAGLVALQGLRDKGRITNDVKVLINGASGGVGTFAIQIAKTFGAEVTAVCSTENVEKARSLGADFVVDYTKEDFTKNGKSYDLILAVNGYHSIFDYKNSLHAGGTYVTTGGAGAQMFQGLALGPILSRVGGKKMENLLIKPNKKDLILLGELLASGKVRSVIDRSYPLEKLADAIEYLETGHARGKVVITFA